MQVLSFVNTSGPEPWKSHDAKRFVRSHAMKDYRRKQREQQKKRKTTGDQSQPGESSFAVASVLPDQENARVFAQRTASGLIGIPSPTSSIESYTGRKSSPPSVSCSLQEFIDRATASPETCSVLPQIFPLLDAYDSNLIPSPSPSTSSDSPCQSPAASAIAHTPSTKFDLSICMTVYEALDDAGANFDYFFKHFFHSMYAYFTILHQKRFLKRVYGLSKKANAETALLLLCVRICAEPTKSSIELAGGNLYRTAKQLFQAVLNRKGASLELVQAGILLAVYEHNADLRGTDYSTLKECSKLAAAIGLDALPREGNTVYDEERRRTYWGLRGLDCIIALHDEKHERPLILPAPSVDDVLPSVSDADFEDFIDEMPSSSVPCMVSSKLPTWADSFSRQGQTIQLMYMVQNILREKFDRSPDLMISRIEHLDNLIMSTLSNLLADCNGKCTQYCGPISFLISASFLLHEYQLLSTMHNTSPAAHDTNAATRSRLAIETMVDMMVNILREFPVAHTPELSPPALFAPYQAAMLGFLLDRISGFQRPPTLAGSTFDLMIGGLKHFSTVWPCTAEYIKKIERAQSRALPMPLPCAG